MRDKKTKAQIKIKKNPQEIIPTPCWYESTNRHLSHLHLIHNNNTMDTEFLVQMRQSNKCGSVRNDEIFNLHLGSGAGPWVSIPCLLQDTSHINTSECGNSFSRTGLISIIYFGCIFNTNMFPSWLLTTYMLDIVPNASSNQFAEHFILQNCIKLFSLTFLRCIVEINQRHPHSFAGM